jgi:hypothetical protein
MHASIHQTVVKLVKAMEDDEAMQFIYVLDQVKNRPRAYGKMISPCTCPTGIGITPLFHVEAVIRIAVFPATISPLLGQTATEESHIFTEKLMSEAMFPFAKTNFSMMSAQKQR